MRAEPSWTREPEGDETLAANWLLRLRRERYRSRSTGASHDYYVVHLADAVNVIALTPDRKVVLVEQFRGGSGRDSLEPPGGLLDEGEDPLEAGARELLEETGYAGDPPILLGTVWSCPSLLTSRIATVLIPNARPVAEPNPDAAEEVRLRVVPAREVPHLIRSGQIGHALAVQGLLWWLVSELPDTPFELPEVYRPGARQVHIRTLMIATAVVAVVLGLLRAIVADPTPVGGALLFLLLLPIAHLTVGRLIDPAGRITLTERNPRLSARLTVKILATVGLTMLLWCLSAWVWLVRF